MFYDQTCVGQTTRDQLAELNPLVCPPLSVLVVDTYGEWAALWKSQFAALNIPHLRSHTLVHTDPFNKVRPRVASLQTNTRKSLSERWVGITL